MDASFRGRVEDERADLLAELHGVAADAWRKVRGHLDADAYTPFEVAKVAGIATTNVARIAAAMPAPSQIEDDDAPLTEAEVAQARRLVAG
jgi:hypothetical protein